MRSRYRKSRKPVFERIQQASKFGAALFASSIFFLAAIIGITGYQPNLYLVSIVVAAALVGSFLYGVFRARLIHIPDILIRVPAGSTLQGCKFCTAAELAEANSLAAACYRRDAIPDELVEQWRLKNPTMYACVLDQAGSLVAALGVMPLTDSFMELFIEGKVVESQIGSKNIHGPNENRKALKLYISGVVVRDPGTQRGQMRASILLWATVQYLVKLYGTHKKRTLYALAATKQGESILKHLNFSVACPASQRLDKHNLYSLEWSRDTLRNVKAMIPDYRLMCTIDLKYTPHLFNGNKKVLSY